MKKVLVLHPMVEEADFARNLLAGQDDVDVVQLDLGPRVIVSAMDYALAGIDSVRKAKEAEKAGYGAIVLTCHGDPNVYNLREAVRIPVLGCTQVAAHICSLLARRFSILNPAELFVKRSKEDALARYGLSSKLASIRPVSFGASLEDIGKKSKDGKIPDAIMKPLVDEAIKAIEEDDASALTFGCLFLGMLGDELDRSLKRKGYDVLVVQTLPTAVDMARFLIRNNLTHSARAFPLAKEYKLMGLGGTARASKSLPC